MNLNISLPNDEELKPKIIVFGVGGAGSNAVDNMIELNLEGIEFWIANTDVQALNKSSASNKIKFGITATKGLGAGSDPKMGKIAAEESTDEIIAALDGCNMVFITAGMGGGTGTGGAPIVANIAKERGILTVGVVTKPFHFEGARRMQVAEAGIEELEKYVDTLIIIPNQNLFRLANEKTTFVDAFKMADDVLHSGVRGVTDLITMPGLINLDFADIHSVMNEKGKAMMGTGEAEGENRATKAAEAAISNPLLDHSSMKGAKGVLINITGGTDMTLFEVDEAANRIKEEVDEEANIIFGSAFDENLQGNLRVSVVATGIDAKPTKIITDAVMNKAGDIDLNDHVKTESQQAIVEETVQNDATSKEIQEDNIATPSSTLEDVLQKENSEKYEEPEKENVEKDAEVFVPPQSIDPDNVKDMVSTDDEIYDDIENTDDTNKTEELDETEDNGEDENSLPPMPDDKEEKKGVIGNLFNNITPNNKEIDKEAQKEDEEKNQDTKSDHIFDIPAFLRKKK